MHCCVNGFPTEYIIVNWLSSLSYTCTCLPSRLIGHCLVSLISTTSTIIKNSTFSNRRTKCISFLFSSFMAHSFSDKQREFDVNQIDDTDRHQGRLFHWFGCLVLNNGNVAMNCDQDIGALTFYFQFSRVISILMILVSVLGLVGNFVNILVLSRWVVQLRIIFSNLTESLCIRTWQMIS